MHGTTGGRLVPCTALGWARRATTRRTWWLAGRRSGSQDHSRLGGLDVAKDVELDRRSRHVLARDQIERMRRIERRAVDRGDDVTGLDAALGGRAAGDDGGLRRARDALLARLLSIRVEGELAVRILEPAAALAVGLVHRRDRRDPRAVVDRELVLALDGRVDRLEADAEVRAGQGLSGARLREERLGDVDGDGEADVLRLAGRGRVDADDLAGRVEQRTAAVARVDRGIGLDQVRQGRAVLDRDASAKGRDDAARDRVGECAERAPDRDGLLADLDVR